MTFKVDLYYSMRSPYCYLSTFRLAKLVEKYDLFFNLKPVYPLAITDPGIFKRSNPLWPAYLLKDTARIARRLGVPYEWPRPDPIVQNFDTLEICKVIQFFEKLIHVQYKVHFKPVHLIFESIHHPC